MDKEVELVHQGRNKEAVQGDGEIRLDGIDGEKEFVWYGVKVTVTISIVNAVLLINEKKAEGLRR